MKWWTSVSLLLVIYGCAGTTSNTGVETLTATRLYFGMSRPGGVVTVEEYRGFLSAVVTPRFPDGLTSVPGFGQWRHPETGVIVREDCRVLLLLHDGADDAERRLEEIIASYKTRFEQHSVLRVDSPSAVRF